MSVQFVTRKVHALIDYPVAAALIGGPFLLGIGTDNPLARSLSVVVGVAALLLTLLTDHETGVVRVIPYAFHVLVDRVVGVTFVLAPFVLGFTGVDAVYYWVNAGAVLLATVVLAAPHQMSMTEEASRT